MGICSSCDATNVATAKLISLDGRLQEFPYPVKVAFVLQKNPSSFICNSDSMDFDDVVTAVSEDDELMPGQLYFALPLSRLRRRLPAEEMAALAVKASSALAKCGGVFNVTDKCKVVESGEKKTVDNRRRRRSSGSVGSFSARLTAIPE